MIHSVAVGVATHRPPMIYQFRRYEIEADTAADALVTACWMAACRGVMAVWAGSCDDVEFVPQTWIRS